MFTPLRKLCSHEQGLRNGWVREIHEYFASHWAQNIFFGAALLPAWVTHNLSASLLAAGVRQVWARESAKK